MQTNNYNRNNFGLNIIEEAIYKRSLKILNLFKIGEKINDLFLSYNDLKEIKENYINFCLDFEDKTGKNFDYKTFILQLSSLGEPKINKLLEEIGINMRDFEHIKVEYAVGRYTNIGEFIYNIFKIDPIGNYLKARQDRLKRELNLNIR